MTDLPERFIGGTAAAAIAGVNPPRWAQPIDVYLELTGQAPERASSRMMGMGQLLEPVVAGLFTEATGLGLRRPAQRPGRSCPVCTRYGHACTATRSRVYPWAGAHLDRWASDGLPFEAKWGEQRHAWGEGFGAGTTDAPVVIPAPDDPTYQPRVPLHYAVQVQHYLAVTGAPGAYLAVLLGYGDFRWYVLWRNEQTIGALMELEERFWREHVLAEVPPPPDGSEGYAQHLRATLVASDELEAVATPEQQALAEALRQAQLGRDAALREYERAAQALQLSMGTTTRLVGDGFSVSWKPQAPALRVQWEPLAIALLGRDEATVSAIASVTGGAWPAHKKVRAALVREVAQALELAARDEVGTRPFKPTFDSDEEGT
jgi:predicted phage-related endonuclease